MTTIEKMLTKLDQIESENYSKVNEIKTELARLFAVKFDDWNALKIALQQLEASKEFGSDECGIYRWVRFTQLPSADDPSAEYLKDYLQESHFVSVDFENSALLAYEGPSIVINDDGDIYDEDSGKCIIRASQYNTNLGYPGNEVKESLRNELIENWMDKNGYFPGVFRVDRYGSVFYVNTKEQGNV